MPRVMQVIESEVSRGSKDDIYRMVRQYYTLDGELLAEVDSYRLYRLEEEWKKYVAFLMEKYPPEEGKAWEFTCPYHKKIDMILKELGR